MDPQEWAERFLYTEEEREALLKELKAECWSRTEVATTPLTPFGLPHTATRTDVLHAFRSKVNAMADGKGGYSGDMHALVLLKEKALAFVASKA